MTSTSNADAGALWTLIEGERKQDRLVRRVSTVAWILTLSVLLVFAILTGLDVAQAARLVGLGLAPSNAVRDAAVPFLGIVGATSLLLALVATAGIFLRSRTASLADIQLRLATLEAVLGEERE